MRTGVSSLGLSQVKLLGLATSVIRITKQWGANQIAINDVAIVTMLQGDFLETSKRW